MDVLDIYRHEPDGSFSWITSANSMKMAQIIRSSAANTSEEFLINDEQANESIVLRADGYWFHQKTEQTRVTPNLSNSVDSSSNP